MDDSAETQLCMAALKSESEFEKAKSGFPEYQKIGESVRCNNMSTTQFVSRYKYRRISAAL